MYKGWDSHSGSCPVLCCPSAHPPHSLVLSVHRHSRHGPRPAGGLPHSPDQEAGWRWGDRRTGRRPLSLLEEPPGPGEGELAGSEPLGAGPQGPVLEGGPPDRSQPGRRSPQRPGRPDGAGAGQSWRGETGPLTQNYTNTRQNYINTTKNNNLVARKWKLVKMWISVNERLSFC